MILMDNEAKQRLLKVHLERARQARQEKQQQRHDLFDKHGATLHNMRARVNTLLSLVKKEDLGLGISFPLMWLRKGKVDFQ
jgi:hypothetical protein